MPLLRKLIFIPAFGVIGALSAQIAASTSEHVCIESAPHYANVLIQADQASGTGFGDPIKALNGVRGGGASQGGLDVFSLNQTSDGTLIAAWDFGNVCDGPGADLNVFENSFRERNSGSLFFEPVIVGVSIDGVTFEDFPHQYLGTPSLVDIVNPSNWQGFAGIQPVAYNEETFSYAAQGIDPLDSGVAGGDSFDIATLPDTPQGLEIKAHGFRFVRLIAAPKAGYPVNPTSFGGYADIDGIYAKRFIKETAIEPQIEDDEVETPNAL